jgi:bis(5'-adenosyl)-triphosphatase
MNTKPCPFCNLAERDNVFAESAHFLALYNIAPIMPGHCLVVPKRHVRSLFDLSSDELSELGRFAEPVTQLVLYYFNFTGFDWLLQDGEEAGQNVMHLHLHVIPRRPNDLPESVAWTDVFYEAFRTHSSDRRKLERHEVEEIVQGLRESALENGAEPGTVAPLIVK